MTCNKCGGSIGGPVCFSPGFLTGNSWAYSPGGDPEISVARNRNSKSHYTLLNNKFWTLPNSKDQNLIQMKFFSRIENTWEKEKMLATSVFFYSLNIFYSPILQVNPFLNKKFSTLPNWRVCRWLFQIWWKWQKVIQKGRKHFGKRRHCSLQAISSFPIVFSKDM